MPQFNLERQHSHYQQSVVNKRETTSEYMTVDYLQMIPFLTRALQEQQAIIEELKTRLQILEVK